MFEAEYNKIRDLRNLKMPEQMKQLILKYGPPQSILNSTSNGISA
jgi:hypothetical protein